MMLLSTSTSRFRNRIISLAVDTSKLGAHQPLSVLAVQDRSQNQIKRSINETSAAFNELRLLVERVHFNKARKANASFAAKEPEKAAITVAEEVAKTRITDKPLNMMEINEIEELVTIAVNHKRFDAIIHILDCLPLETQLSADMSSKIMKMVRRHFDVKELRRIRKCLRTDNISIPASAPAGTGNGVSKAAAAETHVLQRCQLNLNSWDLNETMSTCILRNGIGEAFKWFLTMQDVVQIQPTEVTFYLMIPAAISDDKSWDSLFYLLSESKLLGFPISRRSYEGMIYACAVNPTIRWPYARRFLLELTQARDPSGNSGANSTNDSSQSADVAATGVVSASVPASGPSWHVTQSVLNTILVAGRYKEVIETWRDVNKIIEVPIGGQIIVPLGLAALHLGDATALADCFNTAAKPYSLTLKTDAMSDAKVVHAAALDLIGASLSGVGRDTTNGRSNPNETFPDLLGILMAWLMKCDRKDLVQDVWIQACKAAAASQQGENAVMRLENSLSFVCRAALLPGASESYTSLVAAFISELLVGTSQPSPSHRAAKLLNKSATTPIRKSTKSSPKLASPPSDGIRDDENFTGSSTSTGSGDGTLLADYRHLLPLSGELAEEMILLLARTQDTSAASAVVLECEQRGRLIGLDAFTKVLHMLLRDKEYRLLLDLFELYLSRFDVQQQLIAQQRKEQGEEGSGSSSRSPMRYSKFVGAYRRKRDGAATEGEVSETDVAASTSEDSASTASKTALQPAAPAAAKTSADVTLALGPKLFSPALEALAQLGEYDLMLTLFRSEMPRRGIPPHTANFVTAISALRHGGRYRDGFLLFKEYVSQKRQELLSYSGASFNEKESSSGKYYFRNKKSKDAEKARTVPIEDSLITAALLSCAEGRLGSEALQVISMVEKHGRKAVSAPASFIEAQRSSETAGTQKAAHNAYNSSSSPSRKDISNEVRDLKLAITALAADETVMLIPKVIEVMANNRQRPLAPPLGLLCHSLGAAATLKHKEAAELVMGLFQEHGYAVDESAIDVAAQAAKEHFRTERGLAAGFIRSLVDGSRK